MNLTRLLRPIPATRYPLSHLLPLRSEKSHRFLHSTTPRHGNVPLQSIKELRQRTGAPIGAVKKALEEQSGDLEAAVDHLRKLGASMAAKKAHREASEGLVGICISDDRKSASIVELNSETDFVARTPQFGQLLEAISRSALSHTSDCAAGLGVAICPKHLLDTDDNQGLLLNAISSLGENIVLKRAYGMHIADNDGAIFGYIHGSVGAGNGRIGTLLALEGKNISEVGPRLAMHIAAASPSYTSLDSVPAEDVEREREILVEAAKAEQKPGAKEKPLAVLKKIVDGRLDKWYSATVLSEQEMLIESSSYSGKPRTVSRYLAAESKGAKVLDLCRFAVGEK